MPVHRRKNCAYWVSQKSLQIQLKRCVRSFESLSSSMLRYLYVVTGSGKLLREEILPETTTNGISLKTGDVVYVDI